eukprot:jgi/Picsp_1/1774/NSC_05246-R1_protein
MGMNGNGAIKVVEGERLPIFSSSGAAANGSGERDSTTTRNSNAGKNAVVKRAVEGYGTLAVVCMVAMLVPAILYNQSLGIWRMPTQKKNGDHGALLFISIGSAPTNIQRRNAMRSGFELHELHGEHRNSKKRGYHKHVFFTDETTETLSEQDEYKDVEFNLAPGGYVKALYNQRGKYQLKWALEHRQFEYYLRIDDDGALCLDRLLFQLKHIDERLVSESSRLEFFWGKYWCQPGLTRADENFMLLSRHLGDLLLEFFEYLPEFRGGTFALNTGMYLYLMTEKTNNNNYIRATNEGTAVRVFDDRGQIDSQQGHVTSFMRKPYNASLINSYRGFCGKHIWAHHVHDVKVQEAAIAGHYAGNVSWSKEIPKIVSPRYTCGGRFGFNVARHLP